MPSMSSALLRLLRQLGDTPAAAALAALFCGIFLEQAAVISSVRATSERCDLPWLTKYVMGYVNYSSEMGFALAAIVVATSYLAMRTADPVVRLRRSMSISITTFVFRYLAMIQTIFGLYVLPAAKCGT